MHTRTVVAVLAAACACSSSDEPARGRFTSLDADGVRDTRSGLVWTARDAGRALSWTDADRYCRELSPGPSGSAWRLPSIEELRALYDTTMEQPCGRAATCRIDPAIRLSTPYQWSATAPQPDRRVYYDFALGSQLSPLMRPTLTRGVLCTSGEPGVAP